MFPVEGRFGCPTGYHLFTNHTLSYICLPMYVTELSLTQLNLRVEESTEIQIFKWFILKSRTFQLVLVCTECECELRDDVTLNEYIDCLARSCCYIDVNM